MILVEIWEDVAFVQYNTL